MSAEAKEDARAAIRFKEGLPGFEQDKNFILIEDENDSPFGTLQSLDNESVRFIVVDPFLFHKEYEFDLADNANDELQVEQPHELRIRSIVSIRGEAGEASINLVAPIVINTAKNLGKQVILTNTEYSIRHPLFVISEE